MKDQVSFLKSLNIRAEFVAADQVESVLKKVEAGKYRLVYTSPESMLSADRWRRMLTSKISQLIEQLCSFGMFDVCEAMTSTCEHRTHVFSKKCINYHISVVTSLDSINAQCFQTPLSPSDLASGGGG